MEMLLQRTSIVLRNSIVCRNSFISRNVSKTAESRLTDEQKSQILTALNTQRDKELTKYVGAASSRRLMKHREQHGNFDTFESILSVDASIPDKIRRSSKKTPARNSKQSAFVKSITPPLTEERIETIMNVASISLEPAFLTYVKMDQNREVKEWLRVAYRSEESKKTKMTLSETYQLASSLYPKLPFADIFIMQTVQGRPSDTSIPERQSLQTVLYTMLSFGEPMQPKVVLVPPRALASYYDLLMGADRVSCENVFRELMEKKEIVLPSKLALQYEKVSGLSRELLGVSTLLCLAFLKTLPTDR